MFPKNSLQIIKLENLIINWMEILCHWLAVINVSDHGKNGMTAMETLLFSIKATTKNGMNHEC